MQEPWQFRTRDGRPFTIRPVRPEDAPDLYAIASRPEVARTLMLHPAMELAQTKQFMEESPPGRHYLVAEIDGRAAGAVTMDQFQRPRLQHMADLGIMVAPEFWNLGVGRSLMDVALEIADDWLNLRRVELNVYSHNQAAIHLYERCGFEVEGLCRRWIFGEGRWLDSLLMARLRHPEGEPPRDPAAVDPRSAMTPPPSRASFTIRPPREEDAEGFHRLMSHPLVARTTLQLPSQEIGQARKRLAGDRPGLFRFMAEAGGRVAGNASLYLEQNPRRRHAAGLGMAVHPDYWGHGVGSALMEALIDLADNWLNISRIELDVNTDNPAAVHLYQKFGFEIEGTRRYHAYGHGRWADSYFMARLKG